MQLEPGPVALYQQLAVRLAAMIADGRLKANDQLPTEQALMHATGASRVTVRRALKVLEDQGLIVRRHGKGSFVASRLINFETELGFVEAMVAQGVDLSYELIEWSSVTPPPDVAAILKTPIAVRLQRLYKEGECPLGISESFLCSDAMAVTREQATETPLYDILENLLGLQIARVEATVRAITPDEELRRVLEMPRSIPVLLVLRTAYGMGGRPLSYTTLHIRGDAYQVSFSLPGRASLESILSSYGSSGQQLMGKGR